jgi:hypothetical protein
MSASRLENPQTDMPAKKKSRVPRAILLRRHGRFGDVCPDCGSVFCPVCHDDHLVFNRDVYVSSFWCCPSCQQRKDLIRQGDCKTLESSSMNVQTTRGSLFGSLLLAASFVTLMTLVRAKKRRRSTFYVRWGTRLRRRL